MDHSEYKNIKTPHTYTLSRQFSFRNLRCKEGLKQNYKTAQKTCT